MLASLPPGYHALILGHTGAIGGAFLRALTQDPRCARVVGLARQQHVVHSANPTSSTTAGLPGLELTDFSSPARCATALLPLAPFHLVLDATGALILDGVGPEKRLEDLDGPALMRLMQVNAVGPALLLQALWPLLPTGERAIWGKLSARVGSVADNHKGGWYGYRASKAALNQYLQTAAIELARRRPLAVIAALQPGTVRSPLSRPFVGDQALEPDDSAARLLTQLDGLAPGPRATFIDHLGNLIPW